MRGSNLAAPLYAVVVKLCSIWIAANVVYYQVLPLVGTSLSYNSAPVVIAAFFLVWVWVSVVTFSDLFNAWLAVDYWMWLYVLQSIAGALIIFALISVVPLLPTLIGPVLSPYSDILFATPWYFLPKAVEILLQQVLIAALILALSHRYLSLREVTVRYGVLFGSAHIIYFLASSAPPAYALIMTVASVASAAVFPRLILRVRGGFVYCYLIHLAFYIVLAILLQTWPPPGYGV